MQTPVPVRAVLLVDHHPVVLRGLAAILDGEPWISHTLTADTGAAALALAAAERPDLAVVDVDLPGGTHQGDGTDLVRRLGALVPRCRCLVLTPGRDPEAIRRAVDAGAVGFLRKDTSPELIIDALRALHHGGTVFGPEMVAELVTPVPDAVPEPFDRLTPRERRLAGLVAAGMANPAIAARLGVSDKTVRNQLSSLLVKIGVRDRVHLAVLARECRLTARS